MKSFYGWSWPLPVQGSGQAESSSVATCDPEREAPEAQPWLGLAGSVHSAAGTADAPEVESHARALAEEADGSAAHGDREQIAIDGVVAGDVVGAGVQHAEA